MYSAIFVSVVLVRVSRSLNLLLHALTSTGRSSRLTTFPFHPFNGVVVVLLSVPHTVRSHTVSHSACSSESVVLGSMEPESPSSSSEVRVVQRRRTLPAAFTHRTRLTRRKERPQVYTTENTSALPDSISLTMGRVWKDEPRVMSPKSDNTSSCTLVRCNRVELKDVVCHL